MAGMGRELPFEAGLCASPAQCTESGKNRTDCLVNKIFVNQLRVINSQIMIRFRLNPSRGDMGVHMRRCVMALSAIMALSYPIYASAQQAPSGQYSFSFTDASGSSGSGLFTVGAGGQVVAASGTVYDTLATGGPANTTITGTSTYAGADNILYVNAPFVDFAGISLMLADSNYLNLFYSNGTYEVSGTRDEYSSNNPCGCVGETDYSATLDVTPAVPEPATWALMLVGFGGIGFAMRRRRSPVLAQVA